MYDPILLQERMAELGLNWYRLGRRAKVDPKTAKKVVTEGIGQPESVKAVAKALKFELHEIVKRIERGGSQRDEPRKKKA